MRTVRLGDVCQQARGSVKPGACPELRYIGLESIESGSGVFAKGELSKTPETPLANSFRFGTEHVLYGKLRPYLNKVAVPDFEGKCSTEIIPLLPNSDIEREYLAYFLRSGHVVDLISSRTAGARMPRADMDFIFSLPIPLPPLPEQCHIVDLLSRAEGIVRLRREAEKKAAELIPALFLDMFGDPAANPKGWPVLKVGALLDEPPTLGTMAKPSATEGRWLDLRVANIQGGQLTLDDKKWLDLTDTEIERFSLKSGDIVLARAIGSLDHLGKAVVLCPDGDWTFDSHLMRLRFDKTKLIPEVFKGFLESSSGRETFLKHTRRSAVQFNINGKEIRQIEIPVPPMNIQQNYLVRVKEVCSIQAQQSTATAKAKATFDALLAQVFSPV